LQAPNPEIQLTTLESLVRTRVADARIDASTRQLFLVAETALSQSLKQLLSTADSTGRRNGLAEHLSGFGQPSVFLGLALQCVASTGWICHPERHFSG
jgi:hypothetical protein